MSTSGNKNFEEQEIDLEVVSKKISGFFQSMNRNIFLMIQFVLKHIVFIGVLILVGFGTGLYLDKTQKTYKSSLIVHPNFESTDYLYSKIELLNSKIKDNDTLFLKSIGIQNPSKLMNIEISPIVDIYKFISSTDNKENDQNFQILKLMAEDGDITKIISEKTTSKNYAFHKITFNTKAIATRKEIIEPLLNYLDKNLFYSNLKKVYVNNIQLKIEANKSIISQIDGLLTNFSNENRASQKNDKLVYYNENTQLNDLINTKNSLVAETGRLQLDVQSLDRIIKENSSTINIRNTKSINGKLKFILPLLFVFGYILFFFFLSFYKKQSAIYSQGK
jgi:hypothetical protein